MKCFSSLCHNAPELCSWFSQAGLEYAVLRYFIWKSCKSLVSSCHAGHIQWPETTSKRSNDPCRMRYGITMGVKTARTMQFLLYLLENTRVQITHNYKNTSTCEIVFGAFLISGGSEDKFKLDLNVLESLTVTTFPNISVLKAFPQTVLLWRSFLPMI